MTDRDSGAAGILKDALTACATGAAWGGDKAPVTATGSERMRAAVALLVLEQDEKKDGELKRTTIVKLETIINPPPGRP